MFHFIFLVCSFIYNKSNIRLQKKICLSCKAESRKHAWRPGYLNYARHSYNKKGLWERKICSARKRNYDEEDWAGTEWVGANGKEVYNIQQERKKDIVKRFPTIRKWEDAEAKKFFFNFFMEVAVCVCVCVIPCCRLGDLHAARHYKSDRQVMNAARF